MYEFIRKKYEKIQNIKPEVLKIEDIITEEEKQEFLNKVNKFDGFQDRGIDKGLDDDIKKSRIILY
jgi:hypothetical protein